MADFLFGKDMNKAKEYAEEFILTVDHQGDVEEAYNDGYHQAEKDFALTWKDMGKVFDLCYEVLHDVYLMKFPDDKEEQKDFYEEVLKRFKKLRKGQR